VTPEPKIIDNPKYRPDIDGLRAIAVLAVVFFHAYPGFMPGGFIGVDIFFVISGYLISGIVFKSLSEGTFTFTEFYFKRIRRIFPALDWLRDFIHTLANDSFKQPWKA
jgi:peptidoglycan/LPS O-acetylase OafA/YrhL